MRDWVLIEKSYAAYKAIKKRHDMDSNLNELKSSNPELYHKLFKYLRSKNPAIHEKKGSNEKAVFKQFNRYLFYLGYICEALEALKKRDIQGYLTAHLLSLEVNVEEAYRVNLVDLLSLNMIKLISECYFSLFNKSSNLNMELVYNFYLYIQFIKKADKKANVYFRAFLRLCRDLRDEYKKQKSDQMYDLVAFILKDVETSMRVKYPSNNALFKNQIEIVLAPYKAEMKQVELINKHKKYFVALEKLLSPPEVSGNAHFRR